MGLAVKEVFECVRWSGGPGGVGECGTRPGVLKGALWRVWLDVLHI